MEGGIFHAERLLWMAPAEMACHHMAIAAGVIGCFLFHFSLDYFLLITLNRVCNSKSFGLSISLYGSLVTFLCRCCLNLNTEKDVVLVSHLVPAVNQIPWHEIN